jgi:hypothetical protein
MEINRWTLDWLQNIGFLISCRQGGRRDSDGNREVFRNEA